MGKALGWVALDPGLHSGWAIRQRWDFRQAPYLLGFSGGSVGKENNWGLLSSYGVRAFHCGGFSYYGALALERMGFSGCGCRAQARLGFPGALPQRRVVWMWFGALPGAFGLGRAQPQRRGTSP